MPDARLWQRKALRISTAIPLTRYLSDSSPCSSSLSTQSITPGTTPSTSDHHFFIHVLCMHDFESPDPDHLSFHKDEVLTIVKQEHSGWWAAMRSDREQVGWIPSTFVQPLDSDKCGIVPSDEEPWTHGSSTDCPLSAVYDPWVPVCEDCKFQLVTPTDLVPYHFFDERSRDYNCEPFTNLSSAVQFSDMGDIRPVPSTPESPLALPHCPQWPSLSELGVSQLTRPASPTFLHTALHRQSRPYDVSSPFLTASGNSDETPPELISGSGGPFAAHESLVTSKDAFYFAPHNQCISDIKPLELTIWDPHSLAEQLCILMHALYATICKNDCLSWMTNRRSTEVTGLRRFFDTHEHIASWVRLSVFADAETTRQVDVLDFWIQVAEVCQMFGNFNSLCAIILALSGSTALSSLESAWARCACQKIFVTLRDMIDTSNKFRRLEDAMDAAKGPSIPFVNRIKEQQVGRSGTTSFAADADSATALHNMLHHQSSPYHFKIKRHGDLSTMSSEPLGR